MAKRSRREPSRTGQGGKWVGLTCVVILVFFGLTSRFGPRVAAGVAFAAGVIGGLVCSFLPRAPRMIRGGVVTSEGCRFIPLDTDEIDAAIELGPREQAPPGALPPVLPAFLSQAAPETPPPLKPGTASPAPSWPGPTTLRLAGRLGPSRPSPAAAPAAAPVRSTLHLAGAASRGTPAAVTDEDDAPTKRVCPECGAELRQRIAFEGPSAGKFVWGCRAFPVCRYVAPADPVPVVEAACPSEAVVGH